MPSHRRPSPPPSSDDDDTSAAAADSDSADESQSSSSEDDDYEEEDEEQKDEYIDIKLADIRKEVQCPICLGIIRKTRTVMECLHRFCRECIDKSMRLGNNECPACRTHCPSRRSLRDDPNYDALIAALYPDIDSYEQEELAFHEDEKARNKQIQDSIAETIRRQAEALGKKRTVTKTTRRSQSLQRNGHSKRRRINRTPDPQGSDASEDDNGKNSSSSGEEQTAETTPKRYTRRQGSRSNDQEVNIGSSSSSVLAGSSERLSWGKGGIRSNTRHGNSNSGNGKSSRNSRIHKLTEHLRNLPENEVDDIQLMLVPYNEVVDPSLQQPYICCRPTVSVKQLCQYVASQTALQPDEIIIYCVKELSYKRSSSTIDPSKDRLQVLEEQETVAGLITYKFMQGNLVLVYQKRLEDSKQDIKPFISSC